MGKEYPTGYTVLANGYLTGYTALEKRPSAALEPR
jgi:hypothetical protein